jgi:hypothetical protein
LYGWALAQVFRGEVFLAGDLLLALVGVGADAALDGEADLAFFAGDGLLSETGATRLTGDFFAVVLLCNAVGRSVS